MDWKVLETLISYLLSIMAVGIFSFTTALLLAGLLMIWCIRIFLREQAPSRIPARILGQGAAFFSLWVSLTIFALVWGVFKLNFWLVLMLFLPTCWLLNRLTRFTVLWFLRRKIGPWFALYRIWANRKKFIRPYV